MLMAATDEDGSRLSDREVRDQAVTLLFAGHDTSTSTISFMLYELARQPRRAGRAGGRAGHGARPERRPRPPTSSAGCHAWTWRSTRRCGSTRRPGSARGWRSSPSSWRARACPGGVFVNYCSWASHRLPDVFADPEAFAPERFSPGAQGRAAEGRLRALRGRLAHLHRHALRPDGGQGRRDRDPAQRFRLELLPGRNMTVRQMPTLSPRGGLSMAVRERGGRVHAPDRGQAPLHSFD